MTLSKSDKAWIQRALRQSEERTKAHLTDVLTEEARFAVLQSMTKEQPPPPPA